VPTWSSPPGVVTPVVATGIGILIGGSFGTGVGGLGRGTLTTGFGGGGNTPLLVAANNSARPSRRSSGRSRRRHASSGASARSFANARIARTERRSPSLHSTLRPPSRSRSATRFSDAVPVGKATVRTAAGVRPPLALHRCSSWRPKCPAPRALVGDADRQVLALVAIAEVGVDERLARAHDRRPAQLDLTRLRRLAEEREHALIVVRDLGAAPCAGSRSTRSRGGRGPRRGPRRRWTHPAPRRRRSPHRPAAPPLSTPAGTCGTCPAPERVRNPTTAFSSATGSGYVASSRRNTAPVSPYSHSRRRATIDVISGAVRCIAKTARGGSVVRAIEQNRG
jgi:hypothetical protein